MHILLVPHAIEVCTTTVVMLVLLFWPVYICRELTDVELEEAYNSNEQCARELHDHLKLVKNDAVVETLQRSDNSANNISWLNIRHNYYYQKSRIINICAMLGFRERFGAADGQLGSAHLLIPIVGAIICVFFLWAHIFELITNKEESSLKVQVLCGLICWLIISVSLTIIDFNWKGTNENLRNLGGDFPLELKICKYIAWFWVSIKTIELLLADCYQNVVVKFDKPLTLTVVDLPADYTFIDENMSPYPNEYDTMDSIVCSI